MKLHRFYIGKEFELTHQFWLHTPELLYQWQKVLRFRAGDQLVLFDGLREDRLYRLLQLDEKSAHLQLVTELVRSVPEKEVYLLWSILKKDKNEFVLQKATELGVRHFVPLLTARTEKTGFDDTRAKKVIIEAVEQCGRSDVPSLHEPISLHEAISEYASIPLFVAEQGSKSLPPHEKYGILVGPEGGWTPEEKQYFSERQLPYIGLSNFTLRAETAAIAAATLH
jgi:16S rRNA (uracil1498-N3)-methyltransferase